MSLAERYSKIMATVFGDEASFVRDVDLVPDSSDDYAVARGDSLVDDGSESALSSCIPGVPDDQWTQFVRGMICAAPTQVSDHNDLGMFAMKPRRLADLGIVQRLARKKTNSNRVVWVAVFVAPMTSDKFLKSPQAQYKAFAASNKDYATQIAGGKIVKDPSISLSGALAICHRAGPQGLKTWASGERFPATQAAYDRVAGIF